ncbi:MAG TPA: hypothetical protein VF678_12450, partial [bacterium]
MGVESGRKGTLLADLERLEQRIRELEREKVQSQADNARLHAAFDTAPFPVILARPLRDPAGRISDFALA